MTASETRRGAVERSQDVAHGDEHDYTVGSPHLRHLAIRDRIDSRIASVIAEVLQRQDECAVLEIGAGHGSFTETVLAAGGSVTVTEMSRASYGYLAERFRDSSEVRVVYDVDGSAPFRDDARYDVILLISVIHHIPDYFDVITRLCDSVLRLGGTIVTFQDPVWYPRQKRWHRALSWGSYFAWRITQGEVRRGLATRWRRLQGVYSESEPSDLVEYHVVREGVDDIALRDLLRTRFADVEVDRYFSTQSPQIQALGGNRFPCNTFGITARGHTGSPGA
jgi:2-polyprenyl-3-methyl-5-hydroxy-6-metoxy-1,4-benzoquinol methylase